MIIPVAVMLQVEDWVGFQGMFRDRIDEKFEFSGVRFGAVYVVPNKRSVLVEESAHSVAANKSRCDI